MKCTSVVFLALCVGLSTSLPVIRTNSNGFQSGNILEMFSGLLKSLNPTTMKKEIMESFGTNESLPKIPLEKNSGTSGGALVNMSQNAIPLMDQFREAVEPLMEQYKAAKEKYEREGPPMTTVRESAPVITSPTAPPAPSVKQPSLPQRVKLPPQYPQMIFPSRPKPLDTKVIYTPGGGYVSHVVFG